ncbi:MAG TPA: phage portal protein, partial [Chloroflexota bacterium]
MAEMDRGEVFSLYRDVRARWAGRNGEYNSARDRYNGKHWDPATNPAPVNRYSLTLNYLKPFADKSVQSLVGRMPAIQMMATGTDEVARRHAESLEGVLYGTWYANNAAKVFFQTAWDSFVLRRGLIYLWWDPKAKMVKFKNVSPDNFYPEYDGEEMWRAVYASRRNTDRLKKEYP